MNDQQKDDVMFFVKPLLHQMGTAKCQIVGPERIYQLILQAVENMGMASTAVYADLVKHRDEAIRIIAGCIGLD